MIYNVIAYRGTKHLFNVRSCHIDIDDSQTVIYMVKQHENNVIRVNHLLKSVNLSRGIITVYYCNDDYLIITKAND